MYFQVKLFPGWVVDTIFEVKFSSQGLVCNLFEDLNFSLIYLKVDWIWLNSLAKKVFGDPVTPEVWQWTLNTN